VQSTRGRRSLEANMRWWVCGLLIAMACPALAADYDDSWLRGSQVMGTVPTAPPRLYRIWAGLYGGVQVGEDFHGVDYRDLPDPLIASAARQDQIINLLKGSLSGMSTLPTINTKGPSYGGFLGYNWQIDDVVFGVEFNANRSSLNTAAYSSVTRGYNVFDANNKQSYSTTVNVISDGTADMSDYGTVRGRLGWAMGSWLPYMVGGVSFAQINTTRFFDINFFGKNTTTTCGTATTPPCPLVGGNYPFTDIGHGKYILGFDGALGVDYMWTKNVFTRGEVEYLQLGIPNNIRLNTVSARVGLGLRY
jgi:outer membrane immunogenic protein